MPKLEWTPLAERDLYEIHFYIGTTHHSPAAADRFVDSIHEKCRLYARQPELGEKRPELGSRMRVLSVRDYLDSATFTLPHRPRAGGLLVWQLHCSLCSPCFVPPLPPAAKAGRRMDGDFLSSSQTVNHRHGAGGDKTFPGSMLRREFPQSGAVQLRYGLPADRRRH